MRRFVSAFLAMLLAAACAVGAQAAAVPEKFKFDSDVPSPYELGYARYAAEVDKKAYSGQLGAIYSKESTTFRLWSPVASSVQLCIYKTGSDDEPGAQLVSRNPMYYSSDSGVWYLNLIGDYKNLYYTYRVTIGKVSNEVVDPYARAVGVNGNRGMIVDLSETDPEGWAQDSFDRVDYGTDAVVWEVTVRDFSADESSGVSQKNRGKYLAFTETGTTLNGDGVTPTCVDYLKKLGVNYVQINPFYDFASIDEADTETEQYNWGYDPKNYNVPEGSYSSDPYDGRVRIRECKQMIRALHEAGIGVIMDVVYNHTYYSEDSFLNLTVPYYYHRINEDGTWSNGSGCGNDVATERRMVRRMIRDSVVYWAKEYHIDGFRFDLMGLMDVDTMNNIRVTLDKLPDGGSILMYGEAWKMNTSAPSTVKLANQDNVKLLSKRIGAFNDTARNGIKEYVTTGRPKSGVRASVSADGGGWAPAPNQCVNYTSCHDNLTLYDSLVNAVYHDKNYETRREDLLAMNKLSAAIVLMSRGMPFMLAGEEMGRTKNGDGNSYISPVEINRINWNNLKLYTSLNDYYRGLIRLRSVFGSLSDPTGNRSTLTYLETEQKGAVAFTSSAPDSPTMVAAFNANAEESLTVSLPSGKWVVVADRDRAGLAELGTAEGQITVEPISAMVLIDADRFASVRSTEDECAVYVRYVSSDTSSVIREQRAVGAKGAEFNLSVPVDIAYRYDITDDTDDLTGVFEQPCRIIELNCDTYTGAFSTVTFHYVDESDNLIADDVILSNRVGKQYYTPMLPSATGYRLDLSRLPSNGAGTVADDPIEVYYRFKPEAGESTPDEASGPCRVNVICLAQDGAILGTDTFTGNSGDTFTLTYKTVSGYEVVNAFEHGDTFVEGEQNLIVCYAKKASNTWIWFLIAGGVLLLGLGVFLFVRLSNKRRLMGSIDIDE